MTGTASFDDLGTYRYRLTRIWDGDRPEVIWVMLNPSTADATSDDPTIRRVVGFSRSWGFGSAVVVNLFALMATSPADLVTHPTPVGPGNDEEILAATSAAEVVVAWGNHGTVPNPDTGVSRAHEVRDLVANGRSRLMCLGTTGAGQPRHPLYLRSVTTPVPFP